MLSESEKQVTDWYDRNAREWAGQRKKLSEPSFWAREYEYFRSLRNPGSILEIGSGSGREAMEWICMGYQYTGIDNSEALIRIARQTEPKGRYVRAEVYEMPFGTDTFDAFSSWALLPHVPKERIRMALQAVYEVLKSGGIGFVAMREGEGEAAEPKTGRRFSYYAQDECEQILKDTGFEIIRKERRPSRPDLCWLTFFVMKV